MSLSPRELWGEGCWDTEMAKEGARSIKAGFVTLWLKVLIKADWQGGPQHLSLLQPGKFTFHLPGDRETCRESPRLSRNKLSEKEGKSFKRREPHRQRHEAEKA